MNWMFMVRLDNKSVGVINVKWQLFSLAIFGPTNPYQRLRMSSNSYKNLRNRNSHSHENLSASSIIYIRLSIPVWPPNNPTNQIDICI